MRRFHWKTERNLQEEEMMNFLIFVILSRFVVCVPLSEN